MARSEKNERQDRDSQGAEAPLIELAVKIVASYVSGNRVASSDVGGILRSVHETLREAAGGAVRSQDLKPAVAPKKSISDDYIICLEDGKKLRTLKRYLRSHYDLSPEEYRAKWGLPHDYPMVAPSYAKLRSAFAKKIGLGRTPTSRRKRAKA